VKRKWLLWAVAIGAAAAAAFVLLLPSIFERYPTQNIPVYESPVRTLQITDAAKLDSITIYPPAGESYTLQMREGALMLARGGEWADINDIYEENIVSAVTQIVAQAVVAEDAAEVAEHLAEMGLDKPLARAEIRYTDGSTAELQLGAPVPNTTYSYCRWSGSPAVYMCDSGVADALTITANRLLPVEQPQVLGALISRVKLQNPNGSYTLLFDDGAYGRMTEPYAYPLDGTASAGVLSALQNFRLGTREDGSLYSFDQPLGVLEVEQLGGSYTGISSGGELISQQMPAQQLRFTIGRAEGEYFYTCEYEGECYLVSRFLLETLLGASAETLLSRHPADLADAALRSISIQTPDGTAEMMIRRTERVLPNNELETDENGQPVYEVAVTLDGKPGAQEQLDELNDRLRSMTVTGDAPKDFSIEDRKPRWSILLTAENGLTRRLDGYASDLFTDVVAVDGVALHCMDADAIEIVSEGFI